MADLNETIQSDLKEAMRRGEALRVSVLRMALAAMHNRLIEKRARALGGEDVSLSAEEELKVIAGEVKRRRDAAREFDRGGRKDLAEKETAEAAILRTYLPAEAADEEIEKAARAAIALLGGDPGMSGKIIGLAVKELGARVSGDRVRQVVERLLKQER